MKPTYRNPLLRNFVIAAASLLGFASFSYGADLYWDANGDATTAVGGTGNWSATAWRDGSTTGTLGTWVDDNRPVFATTAGIVTLDQNIAADRYQFHGHQQRNPRLRRQYHHLQRRLGDERNQQATKSPHCSRDRCDFQPHDWHISAMRPPFS